MILKLWYTNFYSGNDLVSKTHILATDWEKICLNHPSDRIYASVLYKGILTTKHNPNTKIDKSNQNSFQ